jgi:2'-5' RNA ligase
MEPAKNNVHQSWAEYGLYEYLLVVNPDAEVHDKVLTQKQEFYDEYHEKAAIKTGSHIMVASFLAREAMESTLIRWIQRICDQQQPFKVTLNNYSGFPPHTIFLRVQDPIPFLHLAQKLKAVDDLVRSSSCPPVRLIAKPHLSIARRLPEPVYTKAMFSYSQKTFHESFMVNDLRLLRRAHQFDNCKTINIFPFAPAAQPWSEVA